VSTGNIDDIYELSPLQQGMLLHSLHDGAADMYLGQRSYTVDGPLDVDALIEAWRQVVEAHPALRTTFHWAGLDKPLQVVHHDVVLPIHRHDWSHLDEREQQARLDQLLVDDRLAGFDPSHPPLQRLHVMLLGPGRHGLTWTHHHLLLDGWSMPIFMNEVMARYRRLTVGGPSPLSTPPYRDYIAWLQHQDLAAARTFWMDTLADRGGVSKLLPLRAADPRRGTGQVVKLEVPMPSSLARALRDAAASHRVTLSTVLQAVWAIVLRRYSGRADVTFGCASSGRPAELPHVDRMVGLFANTLPVPVTVPDDGDLGDWLRRLHGQYAAMRRFEYTPLADIKRWAGIPGRELFESLLVLDNYSLKVEIGEGIADRLTFQANAIYDKISYPLTLSVIPEPMPALQLLYHRERVLPGFVDDFMTCLQATLAAVPGAGRVAELIAAAGTPPAALVVDDQETVAPDRRASVAGAPPVPPDTPQEKAIAAVYREILDLPDIDVTASFFDLGGDSFDAVRAAGRIEGVTVGMLAANPSVRALAEALAQTAEPGTELDEEIADLERALAEKRAAKAHREEPRGVVPVRRDGPSVCTYQQESLWFLHRLDPSSSAYHIPFALRLDGALDVPALERAVHVLVERHEALRTRFVEDDGQPRQVVEPPPSQTRLPASDLADDRIAGWLRGELGRPIDLTAGPAFRCALARLGPDRYVLVFVVHHIVADGWSAGILAGELSALYAAEANAASIPLPPLSVQPADHAAWQRHRLDRDELGRQVGYWRDRLAGLPTVDFPADRPRPAQPTGAGAVLARRIPAGTAGAARAYARAHQVSFLAVLQAGLLAVLHRYTGQDDLAVGSVFSGRTRPELEPVVGFFANSVVLRTDVSGEPSFAELVRRCHESVLAATAHQDIPFGLVVDALKPERVPGRNPLFQICLTLQPARTAGAELTLGELRAQPIDLSGAYSRFDVALDVVDGADGRLDLTVEYSTELFHADRMHRLADHFVAALAGGLAEPAAAADDIEFLSGAERDQVLYAWNPPRVPEAPGRLHQVLAGHDPDRVAIRFRDAPASVRELTYGELEQRANRLANALCAAGVGPGDVVGLLLERGLDLPVAQLATMKAGATWMPLDPQHPPARLAFQVRDAAAVLVLTTSDLVPVAPTVTRLWSLDDPRRRVRIDGIADTPPAVDVGPDDAAYLMYTSGSTGTPKGVLVSHRSAYGFCRTAVELFDLTAEDRVAQIASPTFDLSIFDCYAALLAGATLVGAARGTVADPDTLETLLRDERITVSFTPPAMLALLDPDRLADSPLRALFSVGEALSADVARRWSRPALAVHNGYGPTEATVVCTGYRCPTGPLDGPPPIGNALPNHRTYVLDGHLRPVPVGVPGQLFVAGTGLAHGYLNRPGLTAERFRPDPYSDRPGERMYATGDVVRWRSDGLLEYLGRNDRQVKLRGQRIELGEIEHVLGSHPQVRQCAVVLRDAVHLTAYVVGDADTAAVREYLAARLPTFMIPTAFVNLPGLPVTANGKLDVANLPDPEPRTAGYVAPATATERFLAATWQDLLGVEKVGTNDDFFDLGGNSLHAIQLLARVHDRLGAPLDLRQLFVTPVLGQLAAQLDQAPEEVAPLDAFVLPLQPRGTRAPLFFIHQATGSGAHYVPLAQLLGEDQPFYAIEDPALHGEAAGRTVTELAGRYVAAVKRVQPEGPYNFGGWSLGGSIAQEMGRQLTEAGERIGVVIGLDSGQPSEASPPDDADLLASVIQERARMAGDEPPDVDLEQLRAMDPAALEDQALELLERTGQVPDVLRDELRVRLRRFIANTRAHHAHRPGWFNGRLVLLTGADNEKPVDPAGWRALSPAFDCRLVPGNHYTMLRPPNLTALADAIRECLDEAGS
jgi:amino acid adenylation domain-containing protein